MIAKIDSPGKDAQERIADLERPAQFHAGGLHIRPQFGFDQKMRAEIVDHRPAGYPAGDCALERFGHFPAVVVRHPNVEEQVNVIGGLFDIGHHRVDRGVRISHESGVVAADGFEAD